MGDRQIPRSVFRPEDRARILAQAVGQPTGVVLTIGGVDFDLLALSTAEAREILAIAKKLGAIYDKISNAAGGRSDRDLFEALGDDTPRVVAVIKSTLKRSAFYGDPDPDPKALELFGEWFEAVPAVEMLRAAVPQILAANGVANLTGNPPISASETSQKPLTDGISSTPPASS